MKTKITDTELRTQLRKLGYNPDKLRLVAMDFESYIFEEKATRKRLELYR